MVYTQDFIQSEQALVLHCTRKRAQRAGAWLSFPKITKHTAAGCSSCAVPGCLHFLLCGVLMAYLHASVVPHTTPRHVAVAATCCCSDFHASSTHPHERVDCLSSEHVPVCVAVLVLWALPCLLRSGTQCCWPSHSLAGKLRTLFRRCCRGFCETSASRNCSSLRSRWLGHAVLPAHHLKHGSNARAVPALLCFQQPSSSFP